MGAGVRFLLIGNINAITYKGVWPHIQSGRMWLGTKSMGKDMLFDVPDPDLLVATGRKGSNYRIADGRVYGRAAAVWFTNLDHSKRHRPLDLSESYDPGRYRQYDNYAAIEVPRTKDIPLDYEGVMGVPISFLDKHDPEQFEIMGCSYDYGRPECWPEDVSMSPVIDGRQVYKRIFIRHSRSRAVRAA